MYKVIKRLFDVIVAVVLLILLSIPMITVAIAIKSEDGEPIIYKSKRIGKNLKPFYVYKFRSMITKRRELDGKLTHEEMVTKVGKIIRRTSLDELPQLFNILRGEMSFIGPRPWIPEYYEQFTNEQKKRASVIPGISGLAQVKGRNNISVFTKIRYDLVYVKNANLIFDSYLIMQTIMAVFLKSGAEITENGIKEEIIELKQEREEAEEHTSKKLCCQSA